MITTTSSSHSCPLSLPFRTAIKIQTRVWSLLSVPHQSNSSSRSQSLTSQSLGLKWKSQMKRPSSLVIKDTSTNSTLEEQLPWHLKFQWVGRWLCSPKTQACRWTILISLTDWRTSFRTTTSFLTTLTCCLQWGRMKRVSLMGQKTMICMAWIMTYKGSITMSMRMREATSSTARLLLTQTIMKMMAFMIRIMSTIWVIDSSQVGE